MRIKSYIMHDLCKNKIMYSVPFMATAVCVGRSISIYHSLHVDKQVSMWFNTPATNKHYGVFVAQ